jgi:DNA-binding HxlR family transcriptional regulator
MSINEQNVDDVVSSSLATSGCVYRKTPEIIENSVYPQGSATVMSEAGGTFDTLYIGSTHWLVRRLGDRWTLPILCALSVCPMRFAKLKRTLDPISQRMLTLSLKKLERDGLIGRNEIPGLLPQVTYELTALGKSLVERLATFDNWLDANRRKILDANNSYSSRNRAAERY